MVGLSLLVAFITSAVEERWLPHSFNIHFLVWTGLTDLSDITARQIDTEAPAMSNAAGEVVAFDAAAVYKGKLSLTPSYSLLLLPFSPSFPSHPSHLETQD